MSDRILHIEDPEVVPLVPKQCLIIESVDSYLLVKSSSFPFSAFLSFFYILVTFLKFTGKASRQCAGFRFTWTCSCQKSQCYYNFIWFHANFRISTVHRCTTKPKMGEKALHWGIVGCGLISGDMVEAIKLLPPNEHKVCRLFSFVISYCRINANFIDFLCFIFWKNFIQMLKANQIFSTRNC